MTRQVASFLVIDARARTRRRLAREITAHGGVVTLLGSAREAHPHLARGGSEARGLEGWVLGRCGSADAAVQLLREARARGDETPALVVLQHSDREHVNECHRLGARCVSEPLSPRTLALFVTRARASAEEGATQILVERLALESRLTPREGELLRLVAIGAPRASLPLELRLTPNSTKGLVRALLRKTGHASLDALARALLEERLTERVARSTAPPRHDDDAPPRGQRASSQEESSPCPEPPIRPVRT